MGCSASGGIFGVPQSRGAGSWCLQAEDFVSHSRQRLTLGRVMAVFQDGARGGACFAECRRQSHSSRQTSTAALNAEFGMSYDPSAPNQSRLLQCGDPAGLGEASQSGCGRPVTKTGTLDRNVYGRMSWDEVSPTITAGCTTLSEKGALAIPRRTARFGTRGRAAPDLPAGLCILVPLHGICINMIGNALPCHFAAILAARCPTQSENTLTALPKSFKVWLVSARMDLDAQGPRRRGGRS